jgi:hypothetical protein
MVADTPAQRRPNTEGCDTARDTCKGDKLARAGNDDVKNFMVRCWSGRAAAGLRRTHARPAPALLLRPAGARPPLQAPGLAYRCNALLCRRPRPPPCRMTARTRAPTTSPPVRISCLGQRHQDAPLNALDHRGRAVEPCRLLAETPAPSSPSTRNPTPPRRPGRAHDAAMAGVPRRELGWDSFPVASPNRGSRRALHPHTIELRHGQRRAPRRGGSARSG